MILLVMAAAREYRVQCIYGAKIDVVDHQQQGYHLNRVILITVKGSETITAVFTRAEASTANGRQSSKLVYCRE